MVIKMFFSSLIIMFVTYVLNYIVTGPKLIQEINIENPSGKFIYTDHFGMYKKIFILVLYGYEYENSYNNVFENCEPLYNFLKVNEGDGSEISSYCTDKYSMINKERTLSFYTETPSMKNAEISYDISILLGKFRRAELIVTTPFNRGPNFITWCNLIGIVVSGLLFFSSILLFFFKNKTLRS